MSRNDINEEDDFFKNLEAGFAEEEASSPTFIKKISADIDFISDDSGIKEDDKLAKKQFEMSNIFSNINEEMILDDLNIKKPSLTITTNLNQSSPLVEPEVQKTNSSLTIEHKKKVMKYTPPNKQIQFKMQRLRTGGENKIKKRRKFSHIEENNYFVFAEDYEKFIGEFVSDQNLKITRGFINTNEFNRIYYTKMKPQNCEVEANVLMLHGFGHSGKYLDLGAAIARNGYEVHLFDLRGFGFSGGKRYNPKIVEIHSDIMLVIKNSMNKKLPLFIYGHGFGASIIFVLLINNDFNVAGVILSSIMLSVEYIESSSYGNLKIYLIKNLGDFFKDFVINNIVNPTALTKNCYHIKRFLDDRICVPFLGLKFLSNLLQSFEIMKNNSSEFNYNVLMIHGLKDEICSWKRAESLYRNISSVDKTKLLYKNGFHEPFLDLEAEQYKSDIILWIKERSKSASGMGDFKNENLGISNEKKRMTRKILVGTLIFLLYLKGIFL